MSSPPKVLVVDDVEANLLAFEGLLGGLDCEPVRAASGQDALRQLLRHEFAVILLDVQMPAMDGFEVARLARQNPSVRNVPIIFVTAMNATEENEFLGYESGAVDVLFKPVNPRVLLSKVQVFLELYRSRRQLAAEIEAHERTLTDLDAFNYSVSHDLRAPLRPIKGFSELVLESHGDKLDDAARSYLTRIGMAADRMNHLIEDLLRLSTVSRSQLTLSTVNLGVVARDVVSELRASEPSRRIDVVIAPSMPAYGDGRLLRIALENLLRNAWKFTAKSADARVEVGVGARAGGAPTYFVRDNGAGFSSAHKGKLFKAFQRLHSPSDFEGTGIGLAIVDRVIRRHGGQVWADGETGRGATFTFSVPEKPTSTRSLSRPPLPPGSSSGL